MEYKSKAGNPDKQASGCILAPILGGTQLSASAKLLDQACGGAISKLVKRGDLPGGIGKFLLLHDLPNIKAQRVLLLQTGKPADLSPSKYSNLMQSAFVALKDSGASNALIYLDDIPLTDRDLYWKVRQALLAFEQAGYQFNQLKSQPKDAHSKLATISFGVSAAAQLPELGRAIAQGCAIAAGQKLAKDLGNLPGNICTPSYLAEQAKALAKAYRGITTSVLEEKQMRELGMGALLSVSAGSAQPAKLIVMNYKGGAKNEPPQVLVGKGITFDTGGISLKPGAEMDEMKFDMCGAASVFGTLKAAAEMKLALNLVVIVAAAENMPGSKATKPGDIVKSLSGQTIEILNTDAEGRLVLCDALSYAELFNPAAIIDIATLTGACVIALGTHASGLYANQDSLAQELLAAGTYAHDRVWHMPLWDDYQEQLDSNFADMANIGGRPAGSVTAACFLARFTKKQRWAHLDIAGTAWLSGKKKGATGRPVALLTQYLLDRCAATPAEPAKPSRKTSARR